MENKVSIVVAIYKSEPFIEKLLLSIINQTYKNLEILLIDDGSPDNSGKICDLYASMDNRIKVFHIDNHGACYARNFGISKASGDFLVIVDGDDWLSLDYVEYLLNIINITGSDMALSDKIFTTRDQVQTINDHIEERTPEEGICKIIYPHMEIGPWNKIYKMDLIKKNNINFDVPWSGEGLYFASMAAGYSNKIGVGHRKVYNYRLNNMNSGLTKYNVEMATNALWNIKNIKNKLPIRTKNVLRACDWHIWKNNFFVIYLVVATGEYKKYKNVYNECRRFLAFHTLSIALHSKISFKKKLGMIYTAVFPKYRAKKSLKKKEEALKKDIMK